MTTNASSVAGWEDTQYIEKNLLRTDISQEESQECYRQWYLKGTYDKLHYKRPDNYNALDVLCTAFKEVFPRPSDVRVLDIGAGSGLSGQVLSDIGCSKIDAVEPQPDFAKISEDKGIYGKVITQFVEANVPMDVPNDAYDAVVSTGAFGPGHIKSDGIYEMIRIVKPGGYIIVCMREEYLRTVPEYKDRLKPLMDKLVKEGKWRQVKWELYPNHFAKKTGLLFIYQIC